MHMIKYLVVFGVFVCANMVQAATPGIPQAVTNHASAARLLERRTVNLRSSGDAALAFPIAVGMIQDDDFLQALQEAYARMLPTGEAPEFTVVQIAPGRYAYVNREGERTAIEEVKERWHPRQDSNLRPPD
jgi:hypothetical protein